MKLADIIKDIESHDDESTIFAEKIEGKHSPLSDAVVIEMSDEELKEKTSEIAKRRCPGKSYFLEIFLVKEFIEDYSTNHDGKKPSNEVATECLIHYAKYDSYPERFFN